MYVIILKGLASAKLINSSIGNTMIRTLERIRRRRMLGRGEYSIMKMAMASQISH